MTIRTSILALLFLLGVVPAVPAIAGWSAVRDLVRSGDALTDEKAREKIYRKAYTTAILSVKAGPNVSNEYLWLANAAGRLALVADVKERIALSKVVKDNAERAIALDARNGAAYMTLGAWHFYVADLSWVQKNAAKVLYGGLPPASYEKGIELLTKALVLGVENPVEVYYIRGRAREELDRDAAASEDYRRCIAGSPRNAKEREMQADARDRLD